MQDASTPNISERALAGGIAMRRILASTVALPLLLGAGAALADQVVGTVESVDPATNTVVVDGQPYRLEGQAAGLKITEIKAGEKVRLEYDVNTNDVYEADHAK
jgi:hypothetical protein